MSPFRYAPAVELPPYSYVPGHGLPHPVNDPAGHSHAKQGSAAETGLVTPPVRPPADPASGRGALAAGLGRDFRWLFALDLFNHGFYWEAHEAWEGFWHALGRTSPEARFVQGLIHLAAAAVKIREGKVAGVQRHATRARELLGARPAIDDGGPEVDAAADLGLSAASIAAVLAELERYRPECWHTSRFPVVKVLAMELRAGN